MWFRHRAWIPIAWVLSLINFGGVWFAAREGQALHATVHAVLAILLAMGAQRLRARRRPDLTSRVVDEDEVHARLDELDLLKQRMSELEERVDFVERLLAKQREAQRLDPPQD
jgi:hypothetical protein